MTAKRKSAQYTGKIPTPTKTKTYKYFDEYSDLFTGRVVPVPETFLERLGQGLLAYCMDKSNTDNITIVGYLLSLGIPKQTYYQWLPRSEVLQKYHNASLDALADKRERCGLKGEYNAAMIIYSMPIYSQDWKAITEWRESLKKEAQQPTTKLVVVPELPDVPNDPDKPKDC
jgi:hypothetical protein